MTMTPSTGTSTFSVDDDPATPSELLREVLLFGMMNGDFGPAHKFDDRSIGKQFGVSRAVVRDTLATLAASGAVTRAPRSGTTPVHEQAVFDTNGMTMTAPGRHGRKRWLTDSVTRDVPAPPLIARDLEVDEGSSLTLIRRTTMVGSQPVTKWTIWTPLQVDDEWVVDGPPPHQNWYAVAADLTGVSDFTVDRTSTVLRATERDALELQVTDGDPILFNSRVTRNALTGRPVDRSFGRWPAAFMLTFDRTTVHVS